MEEKELKNKIISVIISIIIAMTVFILCDMFFKLTTYNSYSCWYIPIFEILFGVIIYSFLCAICKTTLKATIISYVFIFIISIINEIKITFLKEPLYFADIKFLSKIPDLLNLVHQNTSLKFKLYILFAGIIFMIVLTAIIFLNYRYNLKIKSKKTRAIIIITDVILLILLFFPTNFTKNLYLKIFFNNNNIVDFDTYTTNLEYYQINGFINGMYGIVLNNKFFEPSNYDDEMLSKQLEKVENQVMTEINIKPNIITIFSEAFWDIDQLKEVEFNTQITKNFNELKKEGKFINLLSPSYGGMSENVAFEFLTGGSMNYFPRGYIPVMSLYSRENNSKIPSIVKVLKNNNYSSEIIFGKDYYNSKKVWNKVGFDNYIELSEYSENRVSDKFIIDLLTKKFSEKPKSKPAFYMIETIESHMPFNKDKYETYNVWIKNSNLNEEEEKVLKNYAQSIYNADQQLKRIYDYIKNYEEPTIIIFLGDHLPYLYTSEGNNVVSNLEFFNTDNNTLNNYRLYNTQALILANFDISNLKLPEYLGTDLLFNYIVNKFDIKTENFYKWLYNVTDILSASNRYVSLDKEGNMYNTKQINGDMKKIYDIRELMQYKFFIK